MIPMVSVTKGHRPACFVPLTMTNDGHQSESFAAQTCSHLVSTGKIPVELGRLKNLLSLYLDRNLLSGKHGSF